MGLRCELPATERREIGKKNTSWSLVIVVWLLMPPLILLLSTAIATYYSSVSVMVGVASSFLSYCNIAARPYMYYVDYYDYY